MEIEDERWLGKVFKGPHFFDVIFASSNSTMPVGDEWFDQCAADRSLRAERAHPRAHRTHLVEMLHPAAPPLRWRRCRAHDFAPHEEIDWRRLLAYMEVHWEVLLIHLLNFRWIYPTERDRIPRWLMDDLLDRLAKQRELPPPQMKVCRGRMFSRIDYEIDVKEWGFADVGGEGEWRND